MFSGNRIRPARLFSSLLSFLLSSLSGHRVFFLLFLYSGCLIEVTAFILSVCGIQFSASLLALHISILLCVGVPQCSESALLCLCPQPCTTTSPSLPSSCCLDVYNSTSRLLPLVSLSVLPPFGVVRWSAGFITASSHGAAAPGPRTPWQGA